VCLERGQLTLVSKIEELCERKTSGSGLESGEYGPTNPSHHVARSIRKILALTSPTRAIPRSV
jgi:hypothetical protein